MKQDVEGGCTDKDNSTVANVGRGGGAGQLCSVILSFVSFFEFFLTKALRKPKQEGLPAREGPRSL